MSDMHGFKLPFSRRNLALVLMLAVFALVAASVSVNYIQIYGIAPESELVAKAVKKLDLDSEANNLPTWFQSSLLLLCSFVLMTVAVIRKRIGAGDVGFWLFLGAVFTYLSADESVSIHEQVSVPLRSLIHAHGIFFFAWVIPALLVVAAISLLSMKTLFRLSAPTRNLMIASGILFVSGAVGLEMVGGSYYEINIDATGIPDMTYVLFTTAEEFFEMSGLVLFVFTLLRFVEEECLSVAGREAEDLPLEEPEAPAAQRLPAAAVRVSLSRGFAAPKVARAVSHEVSNGRVLRPRFSK